MYVRVFVYIYMYNNGSVHIFYRIKMSAVKVLMESNFIVKPIFSCSHLQSTCLFTRLTQRRIYLYILRHNSNIFLSVCINKCVCVSFIKLRISCMQKQKQMLVSTYHIEYRVIVVVESYFLFFFYLSFAWKAPNWSVIDIYLFIPIEYL